MSGDFEWDPYKAEVNLQKHSVSFGEAATFSPIRWLWIVPTRATPRTKIGSSALAGHTSIAFSSSPMQRAATESESSVREWQSRASVELMSDPHPEHDDLRPVYDFSRGVRGKHAARFSVSPEEPTPAWMRDAIRYDRLAWISEALRHTQELEGLLVVYLALAFRLEPTAAGRDVSHLLENSEGEAFRRISADLETDARPAASDLRRSLGRLIEERHWLVHRSLHEPVEGATPKAAGEFTARLQRLSADAVALTEQLRQLILARFVRAGMTRHEFAHKAEAVIRQWLAA